MICFVLTYALIRHRTLEPFFRLYLSRLVEACPFPLTLTYIPAKSLHLHPTSMISPVKTFTSAPPSALTIQPLTPKFYTNILKYADAASGFASEMESIVQVCDSQSQRLWASDPALLQSLITCAGSASASEKAQSESGWQRESPPKPFMDIFTELNFPVRICRTYRAAKLYCYLTERFAWGSYNVAAVYGFFLRLAFMWIALRGLAWILHDLAVAMRADHVLMVSSIGFVGVRMWAAMSGYIYG